eukprot:TRINITY_DN24980_c0_g1_i3.p1 TRINITY_DN24980_c0_g1~~TRINITY_DN24980_c0_g1_i3.p1  ORF type:complete len:107 (-),score=2.22 TRINITY_DN24980_c0_g1_i3:146-466(-)
MASGMCVLICSCRFATAVCVYSQPTLPAAAAAAAAAEHLPTTSAFGCEDRIRQRDARSVFSKFVASQNCLISHFSTQALQGTLSFSGSQLMRPLRELPLLHPLPLH